MLSASLNSLLRTQPRTVEPFEKTGTRRKSILQGHETCRECATRALACVRVTQILEDLYRPVVRLLPLRLHQCLDMTPEVVLPTSPTNEVAGPGDGLLLLFDRLLDCPALGLLAGTQVGAFLCRLEFLSRAWREE